MTITNRYLQEILPCVAAIGGGEVREKKGGYETPCPFCCLLQDKERKRKKRVGMFFPDDKKYSYRFNCVRCKESMDFDKFLMKFDSGLFNKYQMERFHAGTTGQGHTLANPKFNFKKPKFDK